MGNKSSLQDFKDKAKRGLKAILPSKKQYGVGDDLKGNVTFHVMEVAEGKIPGTSKYDISGFNQSESASLAYTPGDHDRDYHGRDSTGQVSHAHARTLAITFDADHDDVNGSGTGRKNRKWTRGRSESPQSHHRVRSPTGFGNQCYSHSPSYHDSSSVSSSSSSFVLHGNKFSKLHCTCHRPECPGSTSPFELCQLSRTQDRDLDAKDRKKMTAKRFNSQWTSTHRETQSDSEHDASESEVDEDDPFKSQKTDPNRSQYLTSSSASFKSPGNHRYRNRDKKKVNKKVFDDETLQLEFRSSSSSQSQQTREPNQKHHVSSKNKDISPSSASSSSSKALTLFDPESRSTRTDGGLKGMLQSSAVMQMLPAAAASFAATRFDPLSSPPAPGSGFGSSCTAQNAFDPLSPSFNRRR